MVPQMSISRLSFHMTGCLVRFEEEVLVESNLLLSILQPKESLPSPLSSFSVEATWIVEAAATAAAEAIGGVKIAKDTGTADDAVEV